VRGVDPVVLDKVNRHCACFRAVGQARPHGLLLSEDDAAVAVWLPGTTAPVEAADVAQPGGQEAHPLGGEREP
jgi:hypothetical protein